MFFYLRKLCLKSLFLIALSHLIVWLLFSKKKKKKKLYGFQVPTKPLVLSFLIIMILVAKKVLFMTFSDSNSNSINSLKL